MRQRLKRSCDGKTQKTTNRVISSFQTTRKKEPFVNMSVICWLVSHKNVKILIDSFKKRQSKLTRCVPDTPRPCCCPQKNEHDCWNLVRMVEQNHWNPGYVLMFLVGVDARDLSLLWNVLFWQWSRIDHSRPSDTLAPIFFDVQHDVQCVAPRSCTSSDQERSV